VPHSVTRNPDISIGAKAAYTSLLSYSWNTGRAWPSQARLAADLGVSRTSIHTWLSELQQHGLIAIKKRQSKNSPNVYICYHATSKMSDTEKIRDIMKREEIYSYVLKRLQIDNVTIDTMGTVTPMPDELREKSFQDFSSVDDEAFDSWVATLPVCLLPPLNGTGGEFISDKDMMAKQLEQQQEKKWGKTMMTDQEVMQKVVGHPMPYHFPNENLKRYNLSVLEEAGAIIERETILEELGQRAKSGDNRFTRQESRKANADLAVEVGRSERSYKERKQIGKNLDKKARDILRNTPIANSTKQLLALAKMDKPQQAAVVAEIADGAVSLREAQSKLRLTHSKQTGNQMGLYNLNTTENGEHLSLVDTNAFALEKEMQVFIENNTQQLWNLRFVASEFSVDKFRFDSVCFDDESKSFVIIEYKKDHSFSVFDQGLSYLSTMLQNKSDFILEYNEALGKTLKRDEVDWSQSRIIFISPSFSIHQKNSINFKDMPFELWEIQRYSNNMVSFNQYSSSSNESITSLPKGRHVSKGS